MLHTVEVVNREETLSKDATSILRIAAGSKGEWVDKNAGGGVNKRTSTGPYTVIVQNSENGPSDYMDQSAGVFVARNSSAGELSAHELLGHALGNENNSNNYKHLDAIQMTNMYLRATGDGNFYRNGYWHGTQVIISPADAAKSPSYVQDTNNTVRQIFSMLPVLIRAIP